MLHEFNEKELSITEDGAPILTCHHSSDMARPPYLHPFYAPNGQVVTDDTNIGHQHPPGVCFTRGTVNGAALPHDEMTRDTEASSARFSIVTTWKNSAEPFLIETCKTEVHPRQTEVQILDIEISLHAPSHPLEFTGDVGLSYLAVEMEYRKAANADGRIGESEVNGNMSVWGTLCGLTAAEQIGSRGRYLPASVKRRHNVSRGGRFFRIPFRTGGTFHNRCRYNTDVKISCACLCWGSLHCGFMGIPPRLHEHINMMKNETLFPLYNKGEQIDTPHPPPQKPQGGPQQAHARRVYIETYGCQMNVSDSELMAGILTQSGHQTVTHIDDADVVLVNTCAIRENAETKVINRLKHLNHRKRRQPELIIGVCGCMAQHLRDRLLDAAPYVDIVMGPDAYRNLPVALDALTGGVEAHVSLKDRDPFLGLRLDKSEDYADIAPIRKEGNSRMAHNSAWL